MDLCKQGVDPDHAEQADPKARDDDGPHGVAGAAQNGGEDLHDGPGKIERHKVEHNQPGGIPNRLILGQKTQKRPSAEQDQTAQAEGNDHGQDHTLLHAFLYAVSPARAEILTDEAHNGCAKRAAHGPEDAVRLAGHDPGGHHDGSERIHADLDDHVADCIHRRLQTGRDAQTEHAFQIAAAELEIAQAQAVGLLRRHQLPRQQGGVQHLGCDRGSGCADNAPMKDDHEHGVEDDIRHTACNHVHEGADRIADGTKHVGFHIQDQNEGNAEEIDAQIENGLRHGLLRGLEQTEHSRRSGKAEGHQKHAQQAEDRDRVPRCILHVVGAPAAIELGDDDGRAGSEGNEKADQQIDDLRRAPAHRRQSHRADESAQDQSVHGVIKLLNTGSRGNRQKKDKQSLPHRALGQMILGKLFGHCFSLDLRVQDKVSRTGCVVVCAPRQRSLRRLCLDHYYST